MKLSSEKNRLERQDLSRINLINEIIEFEPDKIIFVPRGFDIKRDPRKSPILKIVLKNCKMKTKYTIIRLMHNSIRQHNIQVQCCNKNIHF